MSADLAIIVPTFRRADLLRPLLDNIEEATTISHRVYFVVESSDKDTLTAIQTLGAGDHQAVIGVHGSCARAWNAGYWASTEPFVFVTNDDVFFRFQWDVYALDAMGANVHVVGVNDGHGRMRSFMLCRRSYIEKNSGVFDAPNTLVHPYQHNYVDTELAEYAKHRGVWGEAPEAVVEHLHWEYGAADASHPNYERSRATVEADHELFRSRQVMWSVQYI